MIKLVSLSLKNFISHKETSILFEETDKVLFDGASGSGKSSIVDALIWVLYGVGRVDNRSLVRRGAKDMSVTVVVFDDSTKNFYEITRSASAAGKHGIVVRVGQEEASMADSGAGGVKETDKYIENLLGASYELFINSVAYPQGNRESFVNATSARRKELLLEILKTQDISTYSTKTKEKLAEISSEVTGTQALIDSNKAVIEANKPRILEEAQIRQRRDYLTTLRGERELDIKSIESEISLVEHQKEKRNAAKQELADALSAFHSAKSRKEKVMYTLSVAGVDSVESAKSKIAELNSSIEDADSVHESLINYSRISSERNSILADAPSTHDYTADIELVTQQIKDLKKTAKVCPSGPLCPHFAEDPRESYLRDQLTRLTTQKHEQSLARSKWEKKLAAIGEVPDGEALQKRSKEIFEIKKQISSLESSIGLFPLLEEITAAEAEASARFDAASTNLPDGADDPYPLLDSLRSSLTEAKTFLSEYVAAISACDASLGAIEELKAMTVDAKLRNSQLVKKSAELEERASLIKELRDAFGTNGIQAVALDYLLPSLEDKINDVLSQLSDFRVRLDTQRSGTSGSSIEGLFITIRNGQGEEFSFDSYSGGEKLKITVAISEALASLQKVGFRILDELFVGLDEDSTDGFAHVLEQVQGNFSQMLCISHLRQIKDTFDKTISIGKINGISKII